MKCQIMCSRKIRKNIINLLSAKLAQGAVKVNSYFSNTSKCLIRAYAKQ